MPRTQARSNLSDYYRPIRLNPVGHDISGKARMLAHERKRRNLIEHHLKLPLLMWKNLRVLEFGPASGENAAILARHGARMSFVEPLDYLIAELKAKFASLGLAGRIEAVHQAVLEQFKTAERFDVVWAEGFVQFLDDAPAGVAKLATFVSPGGLLVTSAVTPPGTFIEFIKKTYLELAASALDRRGDEQRFELARTLFGDQFASIDHSRAFEKWAKDTVLNPLYVPRHFLDFPQTLAALPSDFALHASWPNYLDHDDLVWHKNIKDAATLRAETLRGYYARAPHFIHSIPHRPGTLELFDPKDGARILKALDACYKGLDGARRAQAEDPAAHIAALKEFRRALAPHRQARLSASVVDQALALFKAVAAPKGEASFIRAWKARKRLQALWGSPGQHFAFQRTDLFS